ncbi:MAG: hypothetical protein ACKVPX_14885 [Myxococcaceae bacterium]
MEQLLELAKRQQGVLSRTQALQSGFSKAQIHTRLARKDWNRELPGVFRVGWAPTTTLQKAWCVALWAGRDALISHLTAAWFWGFGDEPQTIEVSSPNRLCPPQAWVKAHQMPLPPHVHALHEGVALTSPARTLFDVAGEVDDAALDGALHRALQNGAVTLGVLQAELALMPPRGRAGTGKMAKAIAQLAGATTPRAKAESVRPDLHATPKADALAPLRQRALQLFQEAHLPNPAADFRVLENGFEIACVDFAWPGQHVVVELLETSKLTPKEATEAATRLTALNAHGWNVVRLGWKDVTENAQTLVGSLSVLFASTPRPEPAPGENTIRTVARSAIAALVRGGTKP